ncbi:prephenate dehydrogenase [Rhodococcus sp. ABRD24]|nr:prephenate dehydrogenase [Rhodococcus sp. ABRD24]
MLVDLLRTDGAVVTVVDPRADGAVGTGDITAPDATLSAVLADADTVILAVPESVALAAVPVLTRAMRADALLVETLSVKSRIHQVLLDRSLPPGSAAPAVGINPMFAPGLGMSGRPVAAVVHRAGPSVDAFLRSAAGWGAEVVRVDAARHDRIVAATQALTHAAVLSFGLALTELDVGPDELAAIAPPPHTTMLALLARVGSGLPEVYRDIQAGNPAAGDARAALARALAQLADTVACGNDATFQELMDQSVRGLGGRIGEYRALCDTLFRELPTLSDHVRRSDGDL